MVMQEFMNLVVNSDSPMSINSGDFNGRVRSGHLDGRRSGSRSARIDGRRVGSGHSDGRRVGSGHIDGRRSGSAKSDSGTPLNLKLKTTPRLDTRASTNLSGISDWSNDSVLLLEKDPLFQNHRHPSTVGMLHVRDSVAEGRLSRSLKHWMPEYELRSLPPQLHPPRQPIYSARLGNHVRIRRSQSTESIDTLLSLFSCSSHESNSKRQQKRRRKRKKKQNEQQLQSQGGGGAEGGGEGERVPEKSIWVELASQKRGALDKMLRMHAMYAQLDSETEIFRRLPDDEKTMVTKTGYRRGIKLGPGRQRSDSCSNVHKKLPKKKRVHRTRSAGGIHDGPLLDFREIRRQYINHRLSTLQQHHRKHGSRRSITRSHSRHSLTSATSSDPIFGNTPRDSSPLQMAGDGDEDGDVQISVWKGDSEILAIDLKRGLTDKVKSKIASTTSALERATGFGDDNASRVQVGVLEEYPLLTEEDYSHVAKIPQRVRISPQLSDVIRTDIHIRMGRPRYHEIRVQDVDIWTKGQYLDRAHRNLKVFNWLHSLREAEFDLSLPEAIEDTPPGGNVTTRDEVVVSVDEPKVKPLLERMKHDYIV